MKRFVAGLKLREPERFDVLEFLPGEEAQVDYGQGALTLYKPGKYRRPYLFVMTLKYSGKSFRKVVWKTNQETWARLHEEAWRSFGGCCQYVVLDNLKEGVIRPDIYEPQLNPVYAEMLQHYGVVADPCRVRDPDRKGSVGERNPAHAGHRAEGAQVREHRGAEHMARALGGALGSAADPWSQEASGPGDVSRGAATPASVAAGRVSLLQGRHTAPWTTRAWRRWTECTTRRCPRRCAARSRSGSMPREIEIYDGTGHLLRRHAKGERKGQFVLEEKDRIFNPSRETGRLLGKAGKIGPNTEQLARTLFARLGRPGQRALYGLTNLPRTYSCAEIEAVCGRFLDADCVSYAAIRRALERQAATVAAPAADLAQEGPAIRDDRRVPIVLGGRTPGPTRWRRRPMPMSMLELERCPARPAPFGDDRHLGGSRPAGGQPRDEFPRGVLLARAGRTRSAPFAPTAAPLHPLRVVRA